jgi:quercetin dioxygenase-like cupin family protein
MEMKRRRAAMSAAVMMALTVAMAVVMALGGAARNAGAAGTPAAPQPIVIENLGSGAPTNGPGQTLGLSRITIQPGAAFPVHDHPGAYVIYIEAGDFEFDVLKGDAVYTPAGSTTAQTIAAGQNVTAHAGDVIFEQQGVVHTAKSTGSVPAVVLTASLLATDQPFMTMTNDEGTPTP